MALGIGLLLFLGSPFNVQEMVLLLSFGLGAAEYPYLETKDMIICILSIIRSMLYLSLDRNSSEPDTSAIVSQRS